MNQKRQPKGIETGGQFAPDVNPESTVVLGDLTVHDGDDIKPDVKPLQVGSSVVVYGMITEAGIITKLGSFATTIQTRGGEVTRSPMIVVDREDFDRAWHVVDNNGDIVAGGPNLSKERVEALAEQKGGTVRRGRDIKIVPFTVLDERAGYKSQAAREAQASDFGDESYWDYLDAHAAELESKGVDDALTRSLSDALRGNDGA